MNDELQGALGGHFLGLPDDRYEAFIVFVARSRNEYGVDENKDAVTRRRYLSAVSSFCSEFDLDFPELVEGTERVAANITNDSIWSDFELKTELALNVAKARVIKSSRSGIIDAVRIHHDEKKRIRAAVDEIKSIIDMADIKTSKKDSIFRKLNSFVDELDRELTRLASFNSAMIEVASATGKAAEEVQPAAKLFERVIGWFGREAEEQKQLPPWEEQKQLPAPNKRLPAPNGSGEEASVVEGE